MAVSRINRRNLEQILGGGVKEDHDVVIKFYGQNCHLCHALRDKFVQISDEYENVFFYAFNMDDGKGLEKKYVISTIKITNFRQLQRNKTW